MNICGQRKSHKVYLCRESNRAIYGFDSEYRFDQDYDDDKCRKRIKIGVSIWNNDNFSRGTTGNIGKSMKKNRSFYKVSAVSLFFLLCPRILPTHKQDFVYLASNLHQRSLILYLRTNDPVKHFDMTVIVNQLNTDRIDEDNRRTRFRRYPLESERHQRFLELKRNYLQELEEKINSMDSSVKTPTTIAKVDADRLNEIADTPKPIQLIQKHRLVEDIVIRYSEIKTMKLRKEWCPSRGNFSYFKKIGTDN